MDLLEGGIRVPYIVRWPARVKAAGVTAQHAITMDWVATFLEAAGVKPHADYPLDGLSLLKVLAKPTLMALNGQEAAFLAGGEFPIPVPQTFGLVTIQFKKFGVGLIFTPNILDSKHISLNVAPEVSELDFSNALRTQGFTVPAITTRRASTTIELADGQSFAIGGLLRDNVKESVKKVPFLGEIPILGALFRSSSFQKNETELVIIVTPHLVKPLDLTAQTLPTDYYVEPNDFEFYVMGFSEKGYFGGKAGQRSPAAEVLSNRISMGSAMEGRVGHLMP